MRQRHMRELRRAMREWEKKNYYTEDEIKKLLELEGHKVKGVRTIMSDGSIEELGEGTVFIGPAIKEEDSEADKILREARDRRIFDS